MYFITMLESKDGSSRCVGYSREFEEAEELVKENACDICDSIYKYTVIEDVPEGIYQYDTEPKWYEYNEKENRYESCDRPEWAKGFAGFGIG